MLGRTWGPSGRSRGAPGMPRDAPEALPRCLRDASGSCGSSREGPGINFGSILHAPGLLPGSILDRFSRDSSRSRSLSWKISGAFSEDAWMLMETPMPCGQSDWTSLDGRSWMCMHEASFVLAGATMHEGSLFVQFARWDSSYYYYYCYYYYYYYYYAFY